MPIDHHHPNPCRDAEVGRLKARIDELERMEE